MGDDDPERDERERDGDADGGVENDAGGVVVHCSEVRRNCGGGGGELEKHGGDEAAHGRERVGEVRRSHGVAPFNARENAAA